MKISHKGKHSPAVFIIYLIGSLTADRKIQLCLAVTHGIYPDFSRKHRPEPWYILVHMQQQQNRSNHSLHHCHKSKHHEHKHHRKEMGSPIGKRNDATVHLQTNKPETSLEIMGTELDRNENVSKNY